jgi:hypothetical protein
VPLVWDGGNVLLRLVDNLDFLHDSAALCKWYGKELPLLRNPFALAVPAEQRPRSPRVATRRVIVNGLPVLKFSPKLAARREVDCQRMETAWAQIKTGPPSWPACSEEQWFRVRAAEKVLCAELAQHGAFKLRVGAAHPPADGSQPHEDQDGDD